MSKIEDSGMEDSKRRYVLPERLNRATLTKFYETQVNITTTLFNKTIVFEWHALRWADLEDALQVLALGVRLAALGNTVQWDLRFRPKSDVLQLRDRAEMCLSQHYSSVEASITALRDTAKTTVQYPGTIARVKNSLLAFVDGMTKPDTNAARAWINREFEIFQHAAVLGYLQRYGLFEQAGRRALEILRQMDQLKVSYEVSSETASLPLISISSNQDIATAREVLSGEEHLLKLFDQYLSLDIVAKGILANVITVELAKNIREHTADGVGWLATRRVRVSPGRGTASTASGLEHNGSGNQEYLEIIIADVGPGLFHDLADVMERDSRATVRTRFPNTQAPSEGDLIEYAFDRLVSRRRDIARLIAWERDDQLSNYAVSSGLFWIWTVARTYRGIITVRAGKTSVVFDFRDDSVSARRAGARSTYRAKWVGTELRLYFPLKNPSGSTLQIFSPKGADGAGQSAADVVRFRFEWLGAYPDSLWPVTIAQGVEPSQGGHRQMDLFHSPQRDVLQRIMAAYYAVCDREILVLDFTGVRDKWSKDNIAPIVHLFVSLNFTSSVSTSAVVLWNVPTEALGPIRLAFEDYCVKHEKVADWLRLPVVISEDDSAVALTKNWTSAKVLAALSNEGQIPLTNLQCMEGCEAEDVSRVVEENEHVFSYEATSELVSLRVWCHTIRRHAAKEAQDWLETMIDTPVREGGALWKEKGVVYRLPSSGLLTDRFFGFSRLLAQYEPRHRLSWMCSERIESLNNCGGEVCAIVTVTLTMHRLGAAVAELRGKRTGSHVVHVSEDGVLALQERLRRKPFAGSAVVLTDVVSSGTLAYQTVAALGKERVTGVIALLDRRQASETHLPVCPAQLEIVCEKQNIPIFDDLRTGDITVVNIDPISVCPIDAPTLKHRALEADFGEVIERGNDVISVGHMSGGRRHYSFFVDPFAVLNVTSSNLPGQTIGDHLVERIKEVIAVKRISGENVVVIHPPLKQSRIADLVKRIETETGASFCVTLHTESVSPQSKYSTLANHGVDLSDGAAILVDDGANSGDTLLALLNAASRYRPKVTVTAILVSRLPLYKRELFDERVAFDYVARGVSSHFFYSVYVGIPVFHERDCPMCTTLEGAKNLAAYHHLKMVGEKLARAFRARELDDPGPGSNWPLRADSRELLLLREDLESSTVSGMESDFLTDELNAAISISPTGDSLDRFAVLCVLEPDLILCPVLSKSAEWLFAACMSWVKAQGDKGDGEPFGSLYAGAEDGRASSSASPYWEDIGGTSLRIREFRIWFFSFLCLVELDKVRSDSEVTARAGEMITLIVSKDVLRERKELGFGVNSPCLDALCALAAWASGQGRKGRIKLDLIVVVALRLGEAIRTAGGRDGYRGLSWLLSVGDLVSYCQGDIRGKFLPRISRESSVALTEAIRRAAEQILNHATDSLEEEIRDRMDDLPGDGSTVGLTLIEKLERIFYSNATCVMWLEAAESQAIDETNEARCLDIRALKPAFTQVLERYGDAVSELERAVTVGESASELVLALDDVCEALDGLRRESQPVFHDLLPLVGKTVNKIWNDKRDFADVPVQECPQDLEDLDNYQSAIPVKPIKDFLYVCIRNLEDRAFFGVDAETLRKQGRVGIVGKIVSDCGKAFAELTIADNGPSLRRGPVSQGNGVALRNRKCVFQKFGGDVLDIHEEDGWTYVKCRIPLFLVGEHSHEGSGDGCYVSYGMGRP